MYGLENANIVPIYKNCDSDQSKTADLPYLTDWHIEVKYLADGIQSEKKKCSIVQIKTSIRKIAHTYTMKDEPLEIVHHHLNKT